MANFSREKYWGFVGLLAMDGYSCSLVGSTNAHEFCKCDGQNGGYEGNACVDVCKDDILCKGYDYAMKFEYCRLFTRAKCPIGCNSNGKGFAGRIGELDYRVTRDYKCAIKEQGKTKKCNWYIIDDLINKP